MALTITLTTEQVLTICHGVPACTPTELQSAAAALTGRALKPHQVPYAIRELTDEVAEACRWTGDCQLLPELPDDPGEHAAAISAWACSVSDAYGARHSVPCEQWDEEDVDAFLRVSVTTIPPPSPVSPPAALDSLGNDGDTYEGLLFTYGWELGAQDAWMMTTEGWNAQVASRQGRGESFRTANLAAMNPGIEQLLDEDEGLGDLHLITAHPDNAGDFIWSCPGAPGCEGWESCDEPHQLFWFGDADERGDELVRTSGTDTHTFHGVEHTWRPEAGWGMLTQGVCVPHDLGATVPPKILDLDPEGGPGRIVAGYHFVRIAWVNDLTPKSVYVGSLPVVGAMVPRAAVHPRTVPSEVS